MSKKITAVEWLQECLQLHLTHDQKMQYEGLFQQAKAIEKEQMKDCYWYGDYDGRNGSDRNFEQYYNETFKPKQR